MKNRITELFKNKKENVLNVFFTAGFPKLNDTSTILESLQEAGVDMVEIGMPYSDPLADGPTIQQSNDVSLANGMSMKKLFEQLRDIREKVSMPILLMGYINPVLQYGIENFCKKAAEVGVDGVILPDLPIELYKEKYQQYFEDNNISKIFLITPNTTDDRVKEIDASSNGFIYVVSTASTTGGSKKLEGETIQYFERLQNIPLKNPRLIGFNVKDNESFSTACKYANGAIIGSAFIKVLENASDLKQDIVTFVKTVKG